MTADRRRDPAQAVRSRRPQFAYVVEDVHRALSDFVERLGVGPWSLRKRSQPPEGRYRGASTSPRADAQERVYAEINRAAVDWNGRDPIRKDMP